MYEHNQNFYTNGSTHPPKSHRGIWALVLCCLIFMGGIVSLLNAVTDIRLDQVQEQKHILFLNGTQPSSTHTAIPIDPENPPALPVSGEWVSPLEQQLRGYPAGLYITHTQVADAIREGDILLSVDGTRVETEDALTGALFSHKVGDRVELTVYRDGAEFTVTVILTEIRR